MYLSSLPLFTQYESRLRKWRRELEHNRNNLERIEGVRKELVEFRQELRKAGYDISLGSYRIKLEGFRHDDALAEGFKRMVLFISPTDLYYLTGSDNHINLASYLERQLQNRQVGHIQQQHFLWFRWQQKVLVLSGSATETRDNFEKLRALLDQNPMFFIKRLKKLS